MGFLGKANDPITEEVDKATNETNTEEDWATIMNICDKAGKNSDDAKNYLRAICKRILHTDPHVAVQAVTLLDACVKNSKKTFHTEVASREFEDNFTKFMTKCHPKVAKDLRLALKRWAENEFKTDYHLGLIPTLYSKLRTQGYDFIPDDMPAKKTAPASKDPNVVDSQEEEEQILKAIELSLKETSGSPRNTATGTAAAASSLYPSTNVSASAASATTTPAKEARKVRALYDFEAAEDNELTFSVGEIIFVLDDHDPNWWKGSNQRGEGLFPANFVTADLSAEPEKFLYEKAKKIVQFKESVDVKTMEKEPEEVEINEEKIDRLLHLLHEADPTNPERDTEEMLKLERECNSMQPLIDTELERVDRKHAQLTQLSADLVEALSLYHTLMREPQMPPSMQKMPYGYNMPPAGMPFSGTLPHQSSMNMAAHPNMVHCPPPGMYMAPGGGGQQPPNMPPHNMTQQSIPHHYNTLPNLMAASRLSIGHMPPVQSVPNMNPGMPPQQQHMGVPTQMQQHEDGRRHDVNMTTYPNIPTYGLSSIPPNFQPVPHLQNVATPSQGPHYVSTSSSHMM